MVERNETTTPCCAARPVCGSGTEPGAHGRTETKRARRLRPAVRRLWCAALLLVAVIYWLCVKMLPLVSRPANLSKLNTDARNPLLSVILLLLVLLNLAGMGMLRGIRLDVEAAARDIAAILSQRPEPK